MKTSRR